MYINALGTGRGVSYAHSSALQQTTGTGDSYITAMKKALQKQSGTVNYAASAQAGNIIIEEALEKMKSDPEWEEAVMDKIKEAAKSGYSLSGINQSGTSYLSGYLLQNMISGGYSPYYSLGLSGYPSAGLGSLAAASYANVMNGGYGGSSLLGNWML